MAVTRKRCDVKRKTNKRVVEIRKARRTMAKALRTDAGFRVGYVSNVAMLLHDRFKRITRYNRDEAANAILKLIFE